MAQQYDRAREIRQARRQELGRLIAEVRLGVEKRATFGEGTLSDWTVDRLERELVGMRRHLRRTLVGAFGRQDGEAVEAELFNGELDVWKDELAELKIDRLARRAIEIHALVQQGREVVPLIEAARREHHAREKVKFEAELAARQAAFEARVEREQPRTFTERELRRLLEEVNEWSWSMSRMDGVIRRAEELELITELEAILARKKFHEPLWDTTD